MVIEVFVLFSEQKQARYFQCVNYIPLGSARGQCPRETQRAEPEAFPEGTFRVLPGGI